ncbi:unnamed protein product [Adineta steineri]|uniref:Carrier domain-containing protein n=1 Tax=Adineta steineri TaxID=433720 RepID=A0A815MWN0_9BILA|nr:unnamed protein product [Adineta steineri]CAF4062950.1 unnamed protein product [Adineta steineri]
MDEQVRFKESDGTRVAVYNQMLIYRFSSTIALSINRLRQALTLIIAKHAILRTAVIYEQDKFIQKVLPMSDDLYDFQSTYVTNNTQLNQILYDEETNQSLFNFEQGRVFRCHILHYSLNNDDRVNLKQNDIVVFNFHHIAIDRTSLRIFINDLGQALKMQEVSYDNENSITYLDYAYYERLEDWSNARQYWSHVLSTWCGRVRQHSSFIRTGKGYTITFDLDHDLVINIKRYTSESNSTLFQIGLAAFFAFLFKMSNSEQLDLCTGIVVANRTHYQLQNMMGFFANTLPFFLKMDPYESFTKLCRRVQRHWLDILPYTHLPYQEIIELNSKLGSSFLRTLFLVETTTNNSEENIELNGETVLYMEDRDLMPSSIAKFDMTCTIYEHRQNETISVSLNASADVYDELMISTMASRLENIFKQLFSIHTICEFSLLLPHERDLLRNLNNTPFDFERTDCIHQEFAYQVYFQSQKLAVELDNQYLTYAELLYYTQLLALYLLNQYEIIPGEIVCQCVERSLSMVIGIMAIQMAGAVYCPLSPLDPQHRLHLILQQTRSRLVLVHYLTKNNFQDDIISIDIDSILINHDVKSDIDVCQLSCVAVTSESITYIIPTSGSTGMPKAAQVRHRNFTQCMQSCVHLDLIKKSDTVLQVARCSFDIHLQDVMGTLMIGATLILLRPGGNIDFDYLAKVLKEKQTSYVNTVPSLLYNFFTFLKDTNNWNAASCFRSVCSVGESFSLKLVDLIANNGHNYQTWNVYGPAEATIICTSHLVNITANQHNIPIGCPLPNYQCLVLDEFLQDVIINQEGDLLVGGIGVFAGYFGRDDLTAKALVIIDDQPFYRTGDLVRLDDNGLLYYQGRKDFQIKLYGQRIELGEIERCLLNASSSISGCIVMKWGEDHLVTYVQSTDINEKQLRQHCQSHLPPHMIPSIFIILDRFPFNANGKIDRKQLPSPTFEPSLVINNEDQYWRPNDAVEMRIHSVWCQMLHCSQISTNTSFFSAGGHSLLLVQLYHRYRTIFQLGRDTISLLQLIKYPTVADHAEMIKYWTNNMQQDTIFWTLLDANFENSTASSLLPSSKIRIYTRREFAEYLRSNVTVNVEELENIYLSQTIQEIYIIRVTVSRSNENNQLKQRLVAIIISEASDATVLKELETTSQLKQLRCFEIPWAVLIQKELLCVDQKTRFLSSKNENREVVEEQYQVILMNALLAHENMSAEGVDNVFSLRKQQKIAQCRSLIESDKILERTSKPVDNTNNKRSCKDILLTGSTGFLGAYLLKELLKQTDANIYCLVRSKPSSTTSHPRVFYLKGDLTLSRLGLDEHQYSILVSKVRSIYHCGAEVNFIKAYTELRSTNVLGTLEIIKLACQANCRVNYISTLDVLDEGDQNGYAQSKQVAENLLKQASERGLAMTILRPGYISWSPSTGDFNKTDWFTLLFLDLIKFGLAPETDRVFRVTPVDESSRTIVKLGESKETVRATINLSETHTIRFGTIWAEICRQQMMEPHFLSVTEWEERLKERFRDNEQLFYGLQLFSSILMKSSSEDTTAMMDDKSDLNLPMFVKELLRH